MIFSRKNLPEDFYIYFYLREDGTPYYCGKGCRGRAWTDHSSHGIWTPNNDRIIIAEHRLTDLGALALERFYIRWYGRKNIGTGILHNKTDGGEGICGAKTGRTSETFTDEWKSKIAKAAVGRIPWNLGVEVPDEQKQRQSNTRKSKNGTPGFNVRPPCKESTADLIRDANIGCRWVHLPVTNARQYVRPDKAELLLTVGWRYGLKSK